MGYLALKKFRFTVHAKVLGDLRQDVTQVSRSEPVPTASVEAALWHLAAAWLDSAACR